MTKEPETKLPTVEANPGVKQVYVAINKVQAALAKEGISKSRKNEQQNFKFRGVDDVMNALSSLIAEHNLLMLPRFLSRSSSQHITPKGGTLFYVVVDAEYDFISKIDGSMHTVRVFGEAMDSGDKATNKAMSAAYKYACIQSFSIPTEGDNDPDSTSHVVADTQPATNKPAKTVFTSEPQLIIFQQTVRGQFHAADTVAALNEAWERSASDLKKLKESPEKMEVDTAMTLRKEYEEKLAELKAKTVPTTSQILGGDSIPY